MGFCARNFGKLASILFYNESNTKMALGNLLKPFKLLFTKTIAPITSFRPITCSMALYNTMTTIIDCSEALSNSYVHYKVLCQQLTCNGDCTSKHAAVNYSDIDDYREWRLHIMMRGELSFEDEDQCVRDEESHQSHHYWCRVQHSGSS